MQEAIEQFMITYKQYSPLLKLALAFSLLAILSGCSNDGIETKKEPAKTAAAAQLSPQEVEMLQVAAKGDNTRVKELLDKGVDVNMRGSDRNTPIMEAAYGGHFETVKLLLDHGADLSAKKNDGADAGGLAHGKEVIEMLKNVSILVDQATKGNIPALKELIDKGTPLNGLDKFGHSALTEASYGGKTDVVKLLLEKGANPSIKKGDGETPLSLAKGQKHDDIVKLLDEALAKQAKTPAATSAASTPAAAKASPAAK
jgi:ankyrin repeat protein